MNLFYSHIDELDRTGKTGFNWWVIPFVVTLSFLWGILGFLCGATEEKITTRTDAITTGAAVPPEAPLLPSADGITPTLQSSSSPAQAVAVIPSVPALQSAPAQIPAELAEETPVPTESSTSSAEPTVGMASEPESQLSPAQTIAMAPPVQALQSKPEKRPPKFEKVVVPTVERAGIWPPNDPDFKNCLRNGNGIRLKWQSTGRAKPIYLMVRQRHDDGGWETWVEKTPVNGVAFTLTLGSAQARNSEFQWVLFQSPTNIPPESNYFCTRG
jgi:hypothetical protein